LAEIVDAGLDHIQLSFQDSREDSANWIAGARAHQLKIDLARAIRQHRIAFTVNLVVHRQNLDRLQEMISFIEDLQPDRMEVAHAQYYGWALKNRTELIPTREQLDRAVKIVADAERRLSGKIRIDSVVPDYYARYPKACMGGWGQRLMLIEPSGKALPCHAAAIIPGLQFDNVRERALHWIWRESSAFQRFRGEDWMPEPCRSCERRVEDFGGCRCQAFLLAGNAAATDPACSLAPDHHVVEAVLREINANTAPAMQSAAPARDPDFWAYRTNPE
jgi:pyrroloquinoline quinone biosynthesis protein E